MLCEMLGKQDEVALYRNTAQEFARQCVSMADDEDHYRLAFDKPGTWSQKYNLVWDTLLGFKLFPPAGGGRGTRVLPEANESIWPSPG